MDDGFKVPSLDTKIKFIPKKPSQSTLTNKESTDENPANVSKSTTESEAHSSSAIATSTPKLKAKCSYVEPKWSEKPSQDFNYQFEVLKNGSIVETVQNLQSKAFWLIGKLPDNDIIMAHPTVSRYHAVLQYRPEIKTTKQQNDNNTNSDDVDDESASSTPDDKPQIEKGWYLYDLSSTHGCFVNKMKIPPKTYVRIRVGYMIKFGASTRVYILQGPDFDAEAESELTVTEIKEQRRQKELAYLAEQVKVIEDVKKKEDEGISWGMADDADEETDLSHNPYAQTNNEELFLDDPKKTLRGYFEREGHDLEYKVDELSAGSFICRVELPITDSNGRNIVAEVSHKGKKKECVLQGALEACRILDRHGVLRQATHEPMKRRKVESSDDDDDEFYDRTTEAAEKRKRKTTVEDTHAKTYEELLIDEQNLLSNLADIESKIAKYQSDRKTQQEAESNDKDLDDFMSNLSNEKQLDRTEIRKLRFEMQRLKNEHIKLQRIIKFVRPTDLPALVNQSGATSATKTETKKKFVLPLFGKKGKFSFRNTAIAPVKKPKFIENPDAAMVEEEDDDEDISEPVAKDSSQIITSADISKGESLHSDKAKVRESSEEDSKEKLTRTEEKCSSSADTFDSDEQEKCEDQNGTTSQALNTTSLAKKKRKRNRNRSDKKHERMDYDDASEGTDSTKYSGWVPPVDQSGDGITDLNSKYGY